MGKGARQLSLAGKDKRLDSLQFIIIIGCRAGRRVQLRRIVNTPAVSVSELPVEVPEVTFTCLNVRSLHNKTDDVLEIIRDRRVDVFCLTETWHDSDSACIGRLRTGGLNVADRPRLRVHDDLSTNHGGVAIVSNGSIRMSPVAVTPATTFEHVAVCVVFGQLTCIVVTLYRPGSVKVQQRFFDELATLMEQVATYTVPVYIAGDFNIRLDRPDDENAMQLRQLVDCYGLVLHDTVSTHQLGGTIDAVITRDDVGRPDSVAVIDVGLSDHHLLQWSVPAARSPPSVDIVRSRPWRKLDISELRSVLSSSALCQPDTWPNNIDEMAALYDREIDVLLDQLIPLREVTRRPRPSDPWFDAECRTAKRQTRRLERAYATACRRLSRATSRDSTSSEFIDAAAATVAAAKSAWYEQRRAYRQLRHQKCKDFWVVKVESERSHPTKLWDSVDKLLGRGRTSACSSPSVETLNSFFVEKVSKVRATTSSASAPTFSLVRDGVSLPLFSALCVDDVISSVHKLPDKSSATDPLPTYIFKQVIDLLAPFVTELFNRSLDSGHFPSTFKEASVTPVLKKQGLNSADASSYRPISNLVVLSKLLERLVAHQLHHYLATANLLPTVQSGFRPRYSTETAVLSVLSDILLAVDRGDFAALVLLDLSAAFDTVDHDILLQRLRTSFGINHTALKWFKSYLTGRTQYVRRGSSRSTTVCLLCGVPQGSVLGPILFIMYTADLVSVIEQHRLSPHLYADDTQIYGYCPPSVVGPLLQDINKCADAVADWMSSNRLQLNADKTEFMWLSTARSQQRLPTVGPMIGSTVVAPCKAVRDLGVYIDADLTMRVHVQRTVSRCFASLRQLRSIRRSVPTSVFKSLVAALVLSRLDYCNSLLINLPASLIQRLQSVQNAAARLIFNMRRCEHITDALVSLHWIRVPERIVFKVATLTYRALHDTAPPYLVSQFTRVAAMPNRRRLRSASTNQLDVPSFRLSTVGSRAFPIAGAKVWNSLPDDVTSAPSLTTFRRQLKTHLFRRCYNID